MPSTYQGSTYAASALWQSSTKVKYATNPKKGKSFTRYAAYEKARTIEESLQLGSKPEDLLFDYERGHLQILGPLRKIRLDPFKLKPKDFEDMTDADRILIRYGCRHDPSMKKGSNSHITDLDKNLKDLRTKGTQLRKLMVANKLGMDSTDELEGRVDKGAYIQRSLAQQVEILRVLDLWGFARNPNRINVMKEGMQWVHSDTIGAMKRRDGLVLPTAPTRNYPNFVKAMTRYLHDHVPDEFKEKFYFTSININKDYAGARHRDQSNAGPSFLKAFGNFKGGQLRYFPGDDHSQNLEHLSLNDSETLDANNGLIFFDGNRAHEVSDFKGSRYSLVYFNCGRLFHMPAAEQKKLKALGVKYPSQANLEAFKKTLEPPSRCGKSKPKGRSAAMKMAPRGELKGKPAKLPGYGYWPLTKQQKELEALAQKIYKKKPLRVAPEVLFKKQRLEGTWFAGNAISLGVKFPSKLKHLEFKSEASNIVDACDILNKEPEKVPKAISKAGYCVVFTNRNKCYYVVYLDDKKEEAMKTAGEPPAKAAKFSHGGS